VSARGQYVADIERALVRMTQEKNEAADALERVTMEKAFDNEAWARDQQRLRNAEQRAKDAERERDELKHWDVRVLGKMARDDGLVIAHEDGFAVMTREAAERLGRDAARYRVVRDCIDERLLPTPKLLLVYESATSEHSLLPHELDEKCDAALEPK
jgi:hypothetical protein